MQVIKIDVLHITNIDMVFVMLITTIIFQQKKQIVENNKILSKEVRICG